MKAVAFLCLLSLAGYVSSTHFAWKSGKQYTYGVRARLFSGPTDINTKYAGLQVEYRIVLTVTGPRTLHLQPQNVKAVELNAQLNGGWRDADLQDETPAEIKAELKRYLESPCELVMNGGVVESIRVEGDLPTWAVNMKKAQASHFVADTTGANAVIKGNLNRQTNSVRPEEQNQDSGFFYETMEETIHGECETYYTVSQNGPFDWPYQFQAQAQPGQQQQQQRQQQQGQDSNENNNNESNDQSSREQVQGSQQQDSSEEEQSKFPYFQFNTYKSMAKRYFGSSNEEDDQQNNEPERAWPQEFATFCNQNDQVYEIFKTVNFTACKNKPVLAYSTSNGVNERPGDNSIGNALTRGVITRYLACGKDRQQYTILQIEQEEQVNAGIRLQQRTLAGTVQNITLLSVDQAQQVQQFQHPKTIQGLSYTFDPQEQEYQRKGQLQTAFFDDNGENDTQEQVSEEQQDNENQYSTRRPKQYNQDQDQSSSSSSSEEDNQNQKQGYKQQQQQQQQRRGGRYQRSVSSRESQESREDNNRGEQYKTDAENDGPLAQPDLQSPPLNAYLVSPLRPSGMQKRVATLMFEIVEDILQDKQSMAESETLSKISTVARIIRQLKANQINALYHQHAAKTQTQEDQTSRNVFLDAVAIAGTNPAMYTLVQLIKNGEIHGEKAAQLIMTFPLYIRTPTKQLIQYIFENLVNSPALDTEQNLQAKTAAILAFSNLLYQAYVDGSIKNSRYPVALYGEFGNQQDVQQKYAQYYVKNLKQYLQRDQSQGHNKHWTITYLKGLGNLGVEEIIPAVQQILDDSEDAYIKTYAVFALSRVIISRQAENVPVNQFQGVDRPGQDFLTDEVVEKQVLPILVSAAFDKGEHPETRMAAVSLLLYTTNADVAIWQQLAYSTWFESSKEYHSYVYSSLKSLSKVNTAGASGALYQMNQKARAVLSLAKPYSQGIAKSRNHFFANFVEHLQSSTQHQFSYFGSKDSNAPNFVYYRNHNQFGNGGFGATPIQISAYGHTIQKLANFARQQFQQHYHQAKNNNYVNTGNNNGRSNNGQQSYENQSSSSSSQSDSDQQQESAQQNEYLQKIQQILGVQRLYQDDENIEGSVNIKIREEMQRFFSFNEEDIQRFFNQAKSKYVPQLLSTGYQFNYQKTIHAVEHMFEMPTGFGTPVRFAYSMPVHISLRGNVRLVVQGGIRDVQFQGEFHPVYAYKSHTQVAHKVPFVGKQYQAGQQRHFVVETPFRALVRKAPSGQVTLAVTPSQLSQGSAPSGPIPLVTYHQRPYTAIITDSLWPTTHKEGGQMSIVHSAGVDQGQEEQQYQQQTTFGERAFGFKFEIQQESEYPEQTEGQSGWVRFWQRFHSKSCYFNLGWLGGLEVKHVERTLVLDIANSETKTIVLALAGKEQQSQNPRDLWQDSSSQSSQSSEESASSESKQDSSSQQEDSNEQVNRRGGRQNRQKVQSTQDAEILPGGQAGYILAAAVIGKKVPIRSPQEAPNTIQKILQKGTPSTIQYFVQISKSTGRFNVRAASGDAANEAAKSLPRNSNSLQALREAIISSPNTKAQPDGCVEFEGEYDAPKHANRGELLVLRKRLLQQALSVQVKGEFQFGQSCSKMSYEIKVQGKLERSPEMTQYAQTKSRRAQKCAEDEQKGFYVSPVCLYVAEHQAAALNQGEFKIQFTDMPDQFVNRTDDVEDFFKAYLYPYLSTDRHHQGAGHNQMQANFYLTPNGQFLDVQILKPNSKISFRGIRAQEGPLRFALPLTATNSLAHNIRDRVLRTDSEPSCSIQGNYANTYDNVTFRFSDSAAQNCYHVLTQDSSYRHQMAVLVKDIATNQKKVVILLEAGNKIELIPNQRGQRQNQGLLGQNHLQVEINDERVESLPRVVKSAKSGRVIARIEPLNEGGVQVFTKHIDVATNGNFIVVYASNALRNRTSGICGDFDGEKAGEFRSPKNCPLSSGSALVASYAFPPQSFDPKEQGACKINVELKKQVAQEEVQCQSGYYGQNGQNGQNRQMKKYYQEANQIQQQNGLENACVDKLADGLYNVVFDTLNPVLRKAFFWNKSKGTKYAKAAAQWVKDHAKEYLSDMTAKGISQKIADALCSILGKFSGAAETACKLIKSGLVWLILKGVNPLCSKTGCCTTSTSMSDEFYAEVEKAYNFRPDGQPKDSESDEGNAYLTPAEARSSKERQAQYTVARGMAYQVHSHLQGEKHMSENARQRVANKVVRQVKEAVEQALERKDKLVQAVYDAVQREMPENVTPLNRDDVMEAIKYFFDKLCSKKQVCFPGQYE